MKFKTDFVSNSSCASFVISKSVLTELQIFMIKNHTGVANKFLERDVNNLESWEWDNRDGWFITETDDEISGDTVMDNFDMLWFLLQLGIDEDHIKYEGCYGESKN